ncbi:MAG: AbrB/MazE/SpoVT family DNA-binding domain-containing protein [Lentisphaeraceae bacterium]|nr:AbrB/MazE/SpoVT family DNA-binding domain-containing protein [Lentisphaeraceae bacterium]
MSTVTISPKFQVVIPKEVRESISLKSGDKLEIVQSKNRIELIPIKGTKDLKGLLKGMNTNFVRDEE